MRHGHSLFFLLCVMPIFPNVEAGELERDDGAQACSSTSCSDCCQRNCICAYDMDIPEVQDPGSYCAGSTLPDNVNQDAEQTSVTPGPISLQQMDADDFCYGCLRTPCECIESMCEVCFQDQAECTCFLSLDGDIPAASSPFQAIVFGDTQTAFSSFLAEVTGETQAAPLPSLDAISGGIPEESSPSLGVVTGETQAASSSSLAAVSGECNSASLFLDFPLELVAEDTFGSAPDGAHTEPSYDNNWEGRTLDEARRSSSSASDMDDLPETHAIFPLNVHAQARREFGRKLRRLLRIESLTTTESEMFPAGNEAPVTPCLSCHWRPCCCNHEPRGVDGQGACDTSAAMQHGGSAVSPSSSEAQSFVSDCNVPVHLEADEGSHSSSGRMVNDYQTPNADVAMEYMNDRRCFDYLLLCFSLRYMNFIRACIFTFGIWNAAFCSMLWGVSGLSILLSQPGPKSGSNTIGYLIMLLLFIPCVGGVRVDGAPTASSGAASNQVRAASFSWSAKHSGSLSISSEPLNGVRKRAYRRALHRAANKGGTFYRGRWVTRNALECQRLPPANQEPEQSRSTRCLRSRHGPRLFAFTWNTGGLSTGMLDEFLVWLDEPEQSHISIVMLQETHWGHDAEWSSPRWHFVHSGDPETRYAGVLCMVCTKIAKASHIAYSVLHPGRLLQLRVSLRDVAIDLLNIYQIPWNTRAEKKDLMKRRGEIWSKLTKALEARPRRNLLLLAGDFNGQLPMHESHVGTAISMRDGHQVAEDMHCVLDLMKQRGLVALNTWQGPRSRMHTYAMQQAKTQIDFVITAIEASDAISKQCVPFSEFPIGDWKLDGQHRPLVASIPANYRPWKVRNQNSPNARTISKILSEDPSARDRVRAWVVSELHSKPQVDAEQLNGILFEASTWACRKDSFPKAHPCFHEDESVQKPIRALWDLWRRFKFSSNGVWNAWKNFVAFRKQRKVVQKASREVRKARVEQHLNRAALAVEKHDMKGLYTVVRQLAPKEDRRRIQIRDADGNLLSPAQELQELRTYYTDLFYTQTTPVQVDPPAGEVASRSYLALPYKAPLKSLVEIPCGPHYGGQNTGFPETAAGKSEHLITVQEVEMALKHAPMAKAVPAHCASGMVWRTCSDLVAPHLHACLCRVLQPGALDIPSIWKDAWLTLLVKSAKKIKRPEALRPIGLQCMGGKAVLKILSQRLKPFVLAYASTAPQMAYLPRREGAHALLRAFSHCREVRVSCELYIIEDKVPKNANWSEVVC